jgi:hypothetical protein
MSQKAKASSVDFDIGVDAVIPSTQEAFREGFDGAVRKAEKEELVNFRAILGGDLDRRLKDAPQFPSTKELFVFIIQYFVGEKEYARRDIDNMAKTVLDVLKGRFYNDDSQVKVLLVGKKKIDNRVTQNFAYIAIKELSEGRETDAMKVSGVERAITLFQQTHRKV